MKKEMSKNEKYAEKWFRENGFEYTIVRQYISKTVWEISRGGITEKFELPEGVEIKKYMEMFKRDFEAKKEIARLRAELEKKKGRLD